MIRQRALGDPWYTVFYTDAHTLWWLPSLFTFGVLLILFLFIDGEFRVSAFLLAAVASGSSAAGVWWRRGKRL